MSISGQVRASAEPFNPGVRRGTQKKVDLAGLIFHDLRRTAARNTTVLVALTTPTNTTEYRERQGGLGGDLRRSTSLL